MHVQGCLEKRDHAEISPGREVGRCALGRKSETSETLQEALGVPASGKHHQPCGSLRTDRCSRESDSGIDSRWTVLHPLVNAGHDLLSL